MKKALKCIGFFLLIFALVSCGPSTGDPSKDSETETKPSETETTPNLTIADINTDYRIEKIGEQWYLIFTDERIYDIAKSNFSDMDILSEMQISMQRLWTILTVENCLTMHEKEHIAGCFPRDEIGVKLIDIDPFYMPELPDQVTFLLHEDGTPHILWHGNMCTWDSYEKDNRNNNYAFVIYEEERFYRLFDPADFSESDNSAADETRRILKREDKIFYVETKQTKPGDVWLTIYAIEDDCCFMMDITCETMPTDDFLLSFSLTPYVPE